MGVGVRPVEVVDRGGVEAGDAVDHVAGIVSGLERASAGRAVPVK